MEGVHFVDPLHGECYVELAGLADLAPALEKHALRLVGKMGGLLACILQCVSRHWTPGNLAKCQALNNKLNNKLNDSALSGLKTENFHPIQ